MIYIRSQYAERVKLLSSSWVDANRDRDKNKQKETLVTNRPRAFGWLSGCLPLLLGIMATLFFLGGLFINHCKDPYMNQSGFHSSFLSCQGVECCSDFEFGSGFWDKCHLFLEGGVKHHVQEPDMMVIILFCDVQVGAYIANPGLRCASSVAL